MTCFPDHPLPPPRQGQPPETGENKHFCQVIGTIEDHWKVHGYKVQRSRVGSGWLWKFILYKNYDHNYKVIKCHLWKVDNDGEDEGGQNEGGCVQSAGVSDVSEFFFIKYLSI